MAKAIKKREPRRCQVCRAPEQSDGIYTTIAPHLGICVDCLNRYAVGYRDEHRQRKRARQ